MPIAGKPTIAPHPTPELDIDHVNRETGTMRSATALDVLTAPNHRRLWIIGGAIAALVLVAAAVLITRGIGGSGSQAPTTRVTPVRAGTLSRGDLAIHTEYPGELVGEVSDLAPKVPGILQAVEVRIGDRVERGEAVAIIDDTDLRHQQEEAQAQLAVARANERRSQAELEGVESELRRSEDLHRQEVLSGQDYDLVAARGATARAALAASQAQVEQAEARSGILRQQLSDTRVLAPFSGTVAARYLDPGALVQPGTPIVRLVEKGGLVVQFRVPERDLGAVREGVTLSLTTQATGEERYPGHVLRISGEVSRTDRTALVEGTPDEQVEILRPGMYAQVRVLRQEIKAAKIAPGIAVLDRVGTDGVSRTGIFTVGEDNTARWLDVKVLGHSGDRIAIETELEPGDAVLTMGHEELSDGVAIRVVQQDERTGS